MRLLDFINEKHNNAYKDFKLVSVIFDEKEKSCTFKFLYKDTIKEEDRTILASAIKQYLKEDVNVIVKCKKAYVDSTLVQDVIYNFIVRNFSSIGVDFVKENIKVVVDAGEIRTDIYCTSFQYDYITNNSIDNEIVGYANSFFFENFILNLIKNNVEEEVSLTDIPTINIDLSDSSAPVFKYHKINNLVDFIGTVRGNPIQIADVKGVLQDIEIAGVVKFLVEKSFEGKRKDKDGNVVVKTYYSFAIVDKTGRMNCVYFPPKAELIKFQSMQENSTIIVHGDVEEFNGRTNFKVKSIAYCEIEEESTEEAEVEVVKEVNDNYQFVFPQPHIEMFQDNLFIEKQEIGNYLLEHDVVVFDIETTGLEATKCEIIEIGAVKLHKGKITETFETLIKPNSEIPDEIIKLTGITPEMVVNAPSIKQVMPDFFKFCYGSTIMAYNIDFDYKFISVHGKKLGYVFDNPQIDVLYLARAFVPGLKNFKLGTVCKKLDVSLENAHRAVHDAMATAEVVIKLNTNLQ